MANTNWKLIADRTGLPVSTIKKALEGVDDPVKLRLILRTLSARTDGRGSRQYEREVPNAPHPSNCQVGWKAEDGSSQDGEGMWDLMYQNYLLNTNQTGDKDNEDR